MSLNPSTSSSFPLDFTIFPPLFSSRRYRPCPGLSAGPAPHTIIAGPAGGAGCGVRGCVTDRIEQEIEEVGYNRYEEGRESKSAGLKREIEKWQAEMGGGGRNARQGWDERKKRRCMLRGVRNWEMSI